MNVFELTASITLDTGEYERGLDRATEATEEFGDESSSVLGFFQSEAASKIASIASSVANMGMGFIQAGMQQNMSVESMKANLTTLLGSSKAAEDMIAELTDFAASTPFEMNGLMEAVQTLLAFGTPAEEVMADISMMGDISLGNNQKLAGLALAFGQVSSQGKMTGQDLMQCINAGFNPLNEISRTTGESVSTLKEKMSKGAIGIDDLRGAMQTATQEGGQFYKGMENGAKTGAGAMSTLKDSVGILSGQIFAGLYPAFKAIIDAAISVVDTLSQHPMLLKAIGAVVVGVTVACMGLSAAFIAVATSALLSIPAMAVFTSTILPIAAVVAVVIAAVVFLATAFAETGDAASSAGNQINGVFTGMRTVSKDEFESMKADADSWTERFYYDVAEAADAGNVFAILLTGMTSATQTMVSEVCSLFGLVPEEVGAAIDNTISTMGGFEFVMSNIPAAAMGNFVNTIVSFVGDVKAAASQVEKSGEEGFNPFAYALGNIAGNAVGQFVANIIGGVSNARQAAVTIAESIRNALQNLPSTLSNLSKTATNGIISAFNAARSLAHSSASNIIGAIQGAFNSLPGILSSFGKGAVDGFVSALNNGKGNSGNAARNLASAVQNGLSSLGSMVSNVASNAMRSFNSELNSATSSARSAAGSIASAVQSGLNGGVSGVTSAASNIANSIINTLTSVIGSARTAGSNIANAVAGGITSAVNSVLSAIRDMINSIKNTLDSAVSSARSGGDNIGRGIIDGLKNGINGGSFPSWLKKVVDDAVAAAKKSAGVSSPSWIFAEIGSYMIEGLKLGMEGEYGSVLNSFSDFADELTGPSIGFNTQTNGAFATSSGVAGLQIVQNIYAAKQTPAELEATAEAYFERTRWM